MQVLILLTAALVPLIMTPGLLFHFDVTPKVTLLLITVSIMLIQFRAVRQNVQGLLSTNYGRWFGSLLLLQVISFAISACFSTDPWLSVDGSEWRRLGLYTITSIAVFVVITAGWLRAEKNTIGLLRYCTLSSIPIAAYAISQYFGFDPVLPSSAYHAGEGPFTIVRPPGTLGHADYLACFLIFAFFVALTLLRVPHSRSARVIASLAAILSAAGLLMAGTRAGLAGTAAGLITLVISRREKVRRSQLLTSIVVLCAAAAFVISPLGAKLRARIHWSTEDRFGGARLLLWRDSIRMIAARPVVGYGPETFIREFPLFQSPDLSRAYPDFFHESPHNIVLDAAASQGLPGALLLTLGWLVAALAGVRAIRQGNPLAPPLLASSVGLLVSHQFIVFVPPTALVFLLSQALLISCVRANSASKRPEVHGLWHLTAVAASTAVTIAVFIYAVRLTVGDHYLELVRRYMSVGNIESAIAAHKSVSAIEPRGGTAELYYSRELAAATVKSGQRDQQRTLWNQALEAGVRCVSTCEQRANAWYSLATLLAAQNDSDGVERALRNAAAWAPNWFKPHWTLALLLQMKGRRQEAMSEAITAVDRNGGKNAEVLATWLTMANASRRP